MKKIVVLGAILHSKVTHLDQIIWLSDWKENYIEDFYEKDK